MTPLTFCRVPSRTLALNFTFQQNTVARCACLFFLCTAIPFKLTRQHVVLQNVVIRTTALEAFGGINTLMRTLCFVVQRIYQVIAKIMNASAHIVVQVEMGWTQALVRTDQVFAFMRTNGRWLASLFAVFRSVYFTFVYILTCFIVLGQLITIRTCTLIATLNVQTMLATSILFFALVDIYWVGNGFL
jgi:hypothetical protein